MILRSVFLAVARCWLTVLLLLFFGFPGGPTLALAADQQEMVGHWHCVHARQGSCPPDGRGRGAEDFWTYPIISSDRKIRVSCELWNDDYERCLGTHRRRLGGIVGSDVFAARLVCPKGYIARNGVCAEVSERNCPLLAAGPVDAITGRATGMAPDWRSDGPTPLELTRSYTSQDMGFATPSQSRLGNAWRTNFDAVAVWSGQLTLTSLVHIMLPDSFEYSFSRRNGAWNPVAPRIPRMGTSPVWDQPRTGLDLSLTVSAGAVTLRVPDGRRYVFNDKGQLARIEFPDGYMQTLTYTDGLNTLVSDSLGRWLEFTYGGTGQPATLLTRVRTSDGKVLQYSYEDRTSAGNPEFRANSSSKDQWVLSSVTYPSETPEAAGNPKAVYEYLPSSVRPFLLTGATDEDGVKTATWTYDSNGRATSIAGIGGANRWSYVYDDAAETVTVTDPEGSVTGYSHARGSDGTRQLLKLEPTVGSSGITTAASPIASRGRCILGIICFPPPMCYGNSDDEDKDDCDKQQERDEQMCRIATLPKTGARARCWESVSERYGACRTGRPLPELVMW
jgi:YD repeat-containing protein